MKISAFFPSCNEAGTITPLIEEAEMVLSNLCDDYEMIIVQYAGETDGTTAKARQLAEKYPKLRLVMQPVEQKGYGTALRMGYEASKYEWIFYSDADMQFYLSDLGDFVPYTRDHDLIIGYREKRQDPLARILMAKSYNLLIRLFLGLRVKDVDCAFKLVRKKVIDSITLASTDGLIDAELLLKAKNKGFKIKEISVSHRPRQAGQSFVGGRGFFKLVSGLLKGIWRLRREVGDEKAKNP